MRVIAGKYKGRKLFSPEDSSVRPTTDKVKEACFSILTNDIYDARVLDLFGGSGMEWYLFVAAGYMLTMFALQKVNRYVMLAASVIISCAQL